LALVIGLSAGCGQKPSVHAAGGHGLPLECEGDAVHCEILTSFQGVNVYRNIGGGGFCTGGRCSYPTNDYGTRWQCVELFNRFFALRFGTSPIRSDAVDLYANAAGVAGLERHPNGGAVPPVPGDAVVLSDGDVGHVAIVVEATEAELRVIEQNAPGPGRNVYRYDASTNSVVSPRKVVGWIHALANDR
jgi:hypothetical protein